MGSDGAAWVGDKLRRDSSAVPLALLSGSQPAIREPDVECACPTGGNGMYLPLVSVRKVTVDNCYRPLLRDKRKTLEVAA